MYVHEHIREECNNCGFGKTCPRNLKMHRDIKRRKNWLFDLTLWFDSDMTPLRLLGPVVRSSYQSKDLFRKAKKQETHTALNDWYRKCTKLIIFKKNSSESFSPIKEVISLRCLPKPQCNDTIGYRMQHGSKLFQRHFLCNVFTATGLHSEMQSYKTNTHYVLKGIHTMRLVQFSSEVWTLGNKLSCIHATIHERFHAI